MSVTGCGTWRIRWRRWVDKVSSCEGCEESVDDDDDGVEDVVVMEGLMVEVE